MRFFTDSAAAVHIAHIVNVVKDALSPIAYYLWAALAIICLLTFLHQFTKLSGTGKRPRLMPLFAALILGVMAMTVPSSATADEPGVVPGLPDLISDPPVIWRNSTVYDQLKGKTIRAMTFDGYLHNIGEGSLDVAGNPQVEGDVVQRIWDGEEWETVSLPTVRFETDDGHNHFHLIGAVEYSLWTEDRQQEVITADKTGFCLVDSEQLEPGNEGFYSMQRFEYCEVDQPDSEELRMGISPGWRDTYDANITMQWVDISNVKPGRYWISAITDPNNEIVEADEDNNAIIFSQNKFAVDGYVARDLEAEAEGETELKLRTWRYGTVGRRSFVVTKAPEHGTLDVPVGFEFFGDTVTYTPEAGYEGTDSFEYEAHNLALPYPADAAKGTMTIEVTGGQSSAGETADDKDTDSDFGEITGLQDLEIEMFERFELPLELDGADADNDGNAGVRWFASGLPNGVWLDEQSGVIQGFTDTEGDYDIEVVAVIGGETINSSHSVSVEAIETPLVYPSHDLRVAYGDRIEHIFGKFQGGTGFRGTGMPMGMATTDTFPMITGQARSAGSYEVQIAKADEGGAVVWTDAFNITVEPSAIPAFEE